MMSEAEQTQYERHMRRALELARLSLEAGGGPFGAVVVRAGAVAGEGRNCVVPGCDPTAHAEVQAIRAACASLQTWDLAGCDIYCSCEPCPMCAGAIQWARISRVFFAADRFAAEAAGFADREFHEERRVPAARLLAAEGEAVFRQWLSHAGRILY
jgi:guanine deaminase